MILQDSDIKDLIKRSTIIDLEELDLIQTYIFEKKGINLGTINRPKDILNIKLMSIAFDHAVLYYTNKFNGN